MPGITCFLDEWPDSDYKDSRRYAGAGFWPVSCGNLDHTVGEFSQRSKILQSVLHTGEKNGGDKECS